MEGTLPETRPYRWIYLLVPPAFGNRECPPTKRTGPLCGMSSRPNLRHCWHHSGPKFTAAEPSAVRKRRLMRADPSTLQHDRERGLLVGRRGQETELGEPLQRLQRFGKQDSQILGIGGCLSRGQCSARGIWRTSGLSSGGRSYGVQPSNKCMERLFGGRKANGSYARVLDETKVGNREC